MKIAFASLGIRSTLDLGLIIIGALLIMLGVTSWVTMDSAQIILRRLTAVVMPNALDAAVLRDLNNQIEASVQKINQNTSIADLGYSLDIDLGLVDLDEKHHLQLLSRQQEMLSRLGTADMRDQAAPLSLAVKGAYEVERDIVRTLWGQKKNRETLRRLHEKTLAQLIELSDNTAFQLERGLFPDYKSGKPIHHDHLALHNMLAVTTAALNLKAEMNAARSQLEQVISTTSLAQLSMVRESFSATYARIEDNVAILKTPQKNVIHPDVINLLDQALQNLRGASESKTGIFQQQDLFIKTQRDLTTQIEGIRVLNSELGTQIDDYNRDKLDVARTEAAAADRYIGYRALEILILVCASVFLSVMIILFIDHRVVQRIEYVKDGMQALSNGDYTYHHNRMDFGTDEIGQMQQALMVFRDAMKHNQMLTEEMIEARNEADRATQAKSDFLANMTHELRTPLNSVIGMAGMMSQNELSSDARDCLDIIQESSRMLLFLINDILDLSKLEANQIELERIGIDPVAEIEKQIQIMMPLVMNKSVVLDLRVTGMERPVYVLGDPYRLRQVVGNYLSNAIKYTEKGRVTTEIMFTPGEHQTVRLRCNVMDTGIGIPEDKLDCLFEKFSQVDSSDTRRYGGTGLGLAITLKLVHLMGGVVGVNSVPGKGSTFWFEIPFEMTQTLDVVEDLRPQNRPATGTLPITQARFLVAEDHPFNRIFIKKLLESYGVQHLDIVEDGRQAYDAMRRQSYDLVLMDCHMPEMSGYEATTAYRGFERQNTTRQHLPIVAVTANAMRGEQEKCLAAGMDDYVSKPINEIELRQVLRQWIDFSKSAHEGGDVASSQAVVANVGSQSVEERHPSEAPVSFEDIVNPHDLLDLLDGDRAALAEFVTVFVDQTDEGMKRLATLIRDGEVSDWVSICHRLKGGAAQIGAERLRHVFAVGQEMAVASAQERSALYAQMVLEYDKVKEGLARILNA